MKIMGFKLLFLPQSGWAFGKHCASVLGEKQNTFYSFKAFNTNYFFLVCQFCANTISLQWNFILTYSGVNKISSILSIRNKICLQTVKAHIAELYVFTDCLEFEFFL